MAREGQSRGDAVARELETRVAALTAELTAAGSVYAAGDPGSQLDFSVRLIDAELVAGPD